MAAEGRLDDATILSELRQLHGRYPNPGAIKRPLARMALKQWAAQNALRIDVTFPVTRVHWGIYATPRNEPQHPVAVASLALWRVLAIAYWDPAIAADRAFLDLLKDMDPRGHAFCRIPGVLEALANQDNPFSAVYKASAAVFDFTRDVPNTDMNARVLTDLIHLLLSLTSARYERRVVVSPAGERAPAWIAHARGVRKQIEQLTRDLEMPGFFQVILEEADRIERQQEDDVRGLPGYEEVRNMDLASSHAPRIRDFRQTLADLGIRDYLSQWIVC